MRGSMRRKPTREVEAKLSELRHRLAEMRKMRELLFHHEVKAKRISKIKSKAYRKVHKKAEEKYRKALKQLRTRESEYEVQRDILAAKKSSTHASPPNRELGMAWGQPA